MIRSDDSNSNQLQLNLICDSCLVCDFLVRIANLIAIYKMHIAHQVVHINSDSEKQQ